MHAETGAWGTLVPSLGETESTIHEAIYYAKHGRALSRTVVIQGEPRMPEGATESSVNNSEQRSHSEDGP